MSNLESKSYTGRFSLVNSTYWIGYTTISAFASYFLLSVGFSNSGVGVIVALGAGLAAILQPIITSYADREKALPLRILMGIMGGLLALLGLVLLFTQKNMLLSGILFGAALMVLQALLPLPNALGMDTLNQGKKLNFGLGKCAGSVAYALGAYGVGLLTSRFDTGSGSLVIPVCIILAFVLFTVFSLIYPLGKGQAPAGERAAAQSFGDFLKNNKKFMLYLLGWVLLYANHCFVNIYTLQIIESKGGTSAEMGTATAIAALCEMPMMFLFTRVVKKIRCDILLKISAVAFVVKSVVSTYVTTVAGFYLAQALQLFAWGFVFVSIIYYVNELMRPGDRIKGQGYASMSFTLGYVMASLLGGWLLDLGGGSIQLMMTVCNLVGLAGMVIVFIFSEKVYVGEKRQN